MESRKIEITKTNNGKWHCLSFPEVGNYNVSCQIDIHIFKNLDLEIDFAKKHGVCYENLVDVKKYCNHFLKTGKSIYEDEDEDIIKKEEEEFRIFFLRMEENIKNISLKTHDRKTYLMKDNHNGLYKIGISKNPEFREVTLQSQKPSIKMVKTWDKDIEKHLHKTYHNNRVRGEWFDLTKVQVKYICTHF